MQNRYEILQSATTEELFYDVATGNEIGQLAGNEMQGLKAPLIHMDNILCWNIRGLKKMCKQLEVRKFHSCT